jgi:lipopolysaccharide transport system ATP-binding protein
MSGELLIALKNIGVSFNIGKSIFRKEKIQAIQDVSMELYRGDSLGVIGRNGAGKSTLLQVLGGIIRPDTGTIINNNATTSLMALQAGFDPELSGRLNILVSGMLLGFRKADIKKNMDKIIAFSELENFIDRPVKAYSTGMKARLGFSLALEMNPDVLLIDEVLGVGDVQFRKKAVAVMKEKFLSEQTIVLVSHDAITVKTLCNRAVWIENGVTRMAGPSDQVVTAYEDYVKNPPKKLSI